METLQNLTAPVVDISGISDEDVKLTQAKDNYITFVAAGGLSVDDDGEIKKIPAQKFAESIGYSRQTLYNWQKEIPSFWDRVKIRRREIFVKNRENVIWRGLFLRAAKGDHKQAEMILSHFSDYTPPTQKHEVKVSGLSDLAKLARAKNERVLPDATNNSSD